MWVYYTLTSWKRPRKGNDANSTKIELHTYGQMDKEMEGQTAGWTDEQS